MIEEIMQNFYRVEIPLPRNPLKALNSYLIKSDDRFLIIDTGMNREECISAMRSSLKKLDVDLKKTDFFITHVHVDHLGMIANLASDTSKVYLNKMEIPLAIVERTEGRWEELYKFYNSNGFPGGELKQSMSRHPAFLYGLRDHVDFCSLQEDDTIEIGDYVFRCIETPGHSPGHICLYETEKKVLVSGDHILVDITPNISYWPEMEDSLKEYLESLDKIYPLDVNLVLTGHRSICRDHRKRITELKKHHRDRLNEVLLAVDGKEKTAWEIAPSISWDIEYSSWDQFPIAQKWFAIGETTAHLHFLTGNGKVRRKIRDQKVLYSLR